LRQPGNLAEVYWKIISSTEAPRELRRLPDEDYIKKIKLLQWGDYPQYSYE